MTPLVVIDPESVLPFTRTDDTIGIDISGFASTDYISVALPDFPLSSIDTALSYFDLTSNADGNFATGPTNSIRFNQSTVALVQGDSELRLPLSLFTTVDKSKIAAVRFRIHATVNCTFRATAIRVISADWKYAPIDLDTLYNQARRPVTRDGALYKASEFPVQTGDPDLPAEWPIVFRADSPSSSADPQPYDASIGVFLRTGGLNSATGDEDSAGLFNGTSSYGQVSSASGLNPTAAITLEAWVKGTGTNRQILRKGNQYQLRFTSTGDLQASTWSATVVRDSLISGVNNGAWHHIVMTYDGTTQRLYVDGAQVDSDAATGAIDTSASDLYVGAISGTSEFFNGNIDEVAIYPTALSAARIRQHYQTAKAIPGRYLNEVLADNPNAFWRLKSSTTLQDTTSNGHNGTLTGVTTATSVLDQTKISNRVTLYFRELPLDEQTQLDLDGTTMAELDSSGLQPDFGTAKYTNRTMADLDLETQQTLFGDTQFNIERLPDYTSEAWIEVKLVWNGRRTTLSILNANGSGYSFDGIPVLSTSSPFYFMVADLIADTIRVRIYQSDESGSLLTGTTPYAIHFDTTKIADPDLLARRKGRFGWWAEFADGDAAIENIRPRGLNFGEVVTKTLESNTPVEGATLDFGGSADKPLFAGIPTIGPWGGEGVADPTKTSSGNAYRIQSVGGQVLQGIQTGSFLLDDLSQLEINFDLLFPSHALTSANTGLEAFLYGEFARIIPLHMGTITPDRWHNVKIHLPHDHFQSGEYRLMVVQTLPLSDVTWWVDNFDIRARSVVWEGRGRRPDPWGMEGDQWVPFKDTVNTLNGGILFEQRGTQLQVRGSARRQDAFISELKVTPKYAELGRFYWPDEHRPVSTTPVADFATPTISGKKVTYDGTTSTCTGGRLIAYHWSFGDGSEDYGPAVAHTYEFAGTYAVTLTVIDNENNRDSFSRTVTVT